MTYFAGYTIGGGEKLRGIVRSELLSYSDNYGTDDCINAVVGDNVVNRGFYKIIGVSLETLCRQYIDNPDSYEQPEVIRL